MRIFVFLRRLGSALSVIWPPTAIRIMQRGAEEVVVFRADHGREPTEEEWKDISRRVGKEITGRDI